MKALAQAGVFYFHSGEKKILSSWKECKFKIA